jgi:3-phenylpropionate/trans-cinnamate dioxygenase ferredoxin subunit
LLAVPRYIVARAGEVQPGSRRIIEVAGREICVFNVDGEFFAVRNRCPHQGGPLCAGPQVADLESGGPGDYTVSSRAYVIQCPWHHWEFDIRTGESWFDPQRLRVRTYSAWVENGRAVAAGVDGDAGASSGPSYVAEVFAVTVEEDYLVVDLARPGG